MQFDVCLLVKILLDMQRVGRGGDSDDSDSDVNDIDSSSSVSGVRARRISGG